MHATCLPLAGNACSLGGSAHQIHDQGAEVLAGLLEVVGGNVVEHRVVAADQLPNVLEEQLHLVLQHGKQMIPGHTP